MKRSRHLDPIALVFAMGIAATWSLPASAGFTKGPYLQDVSQTSIVVCWESASSEAGEVRFGTTASLGSTVTEGSATLVHQVEVTGLDPSTIYSYQVSSGGALSNLATLHTAPLEEEPFRFVVVGDTRTDGDAHQRVIDRVVNTLGYPDLYFNTGDLVEDGGDIGQWGEFFTIESALLAYSPLFPVAGNHDDYANDSIYAELFHLPTASSGTEGYYAFTYGNTRFIIVDTNDDFTNASTQYQWLEAELIAANANPAIRHEIVLFHDPPYTSGAHGAFDVEDWGPPRNHLVPLAGCSTWWQAAAARRGRPRTSWTGSTASSPTWAWTRERRWGSTSRTTPWCGRPSRSSTRLRTMRAVGGARRPRW
ncbi:MAG: metallophosphoesterase [Deltaproteobacteria bacterium]|nr:metallophosphoesterase [Deltaproteobacteria bacterium]